MTYVFCRCVSKINYNLKFFATLKNTTRLGGVSAWNRIRESICIFLRKIEERMPSSRHPAAVHRTAAFEWVRLPPPPFPNKNTTRVGGVSVWSRIRESNPSTSVAALAFFVFVAEIVAEWILENWILGGRNLWRMPSVSVRQIGIYSIFHAPTLLS